MSRILILNGAARKMEIQVSWLNHLLMGQNLITMK